MDNIILQSGIKTRIFPESNYKGIYFNNSTIRLKLNPEKPITELKYPEFWDIKITGRCNLECPYCYTNSSKNSFEMADIKKLYDFFANMDANQRPFQVAIGGGEPTLHPRFIDILKMFKNLDIIPNFTTNGFCSYVISEEVKNIVGGVAVSAHGGTVNWIPAYDNYVNRRIKTNIHFIISDEESIDEFVKIYKMTHDSVYYFVLLPYVAQGRAEKKDIAYDYFFKAYDTLFYKSKIAFGAKFYPELIKRKLDLSIYEPELLSKFLDATTMKVYPSSFSIEETK